MRLKIMETKNRLKISVSNTISFWRAVVWRIKTLEMSCEEQYTAAANPNTPVEILKNLGTLEGNYVWGIYEIVARNPSTPPETLTRLAGQSFSPIRCRVAQNPNAPQEALAQLAEDGNREVREAVAQNSSTSPEVLTKLAEDGSERVRWSVARNLFSEGIILFTLMHDKSSQVREEAKNNTNLIFYFQKKAEQDGVCEVGQQMPVEWLKEMYLT